MDIKEKIEEKFSNAEDSRAATYRIEKDVYDKYVAFCTKVADEGKRPRTSVVLRVALDEFLQEFNENGKLVEEVKAYPLQRKLTNSQRLDVRLTKEQFQEISHIRDKYRINVSAIIENAIINFLEKYL